MSEKDNPVYPITTERLQAALEDLGLVIMNLDNGNIGIHIFPNVLYITATFGDDDEEDPDATPLYLGRSIYHRTIDIVHRGKVQALMRKHNASVFAPKLYTTTSDDGEISLNAFHLFSWETLASDQQLRAELDMFLSSCNQAFRQIEEVFPDPFRSGTSSSND